MEIEKRFKRVYLINKSDLDTLIRFADTTKNMLEMGRVDKAKESLDRFKNIIIKAKEDKQWELWTERR